MNHQTRDDINISKEQLKIRKVIFDNGRTTYSPLHILLEDNDLFCHFRPQKLIPDERDLRGYKCQWDIANNGLFLLAFHSRSIQLTKIDQLFDPTLIELNQYSGKMIKMNLLQHGYQEGTVYMPADHQRKHAHWFSGDVYVNTGLFGGIGTMDKGYVYTIVEGYVVNISSYNE